MAAPFWQPGHIYLPGDIVQPVTVPPVVLTPVTNGSFETGDDTDWTLGPNTGVDGSGHYTGSYGLVFIGNSGLTHTEHDKVACEPGVSITASCKYQQGAASAGHNGGAVTLSFYDASDVLISPKRVGNIVNSASGGAWKTSSITALAPAGTATVAIGIDVTRTNTSPSWADDFTWLLSSSVPSTLLYKAVQPASGISAPDEPAWPPVLGVQVTDGTVIWEAIDATRVTWQASPILLSGPTEPAFPPEVGEVVADNTISWLAVSRRIEDENCPNSKAVTIVASKVFAVDGDIVRFCATTNPLNWTLEKDAGYLATGLQQANAGNMAVINQYRSNVVCFNPSVFQNWQADPDPAVMVILDQLAGVGSTWQQAAAPVGNDLFYLASLGVRSVGIAGASTNLQAGDVGMPIDPLVKPAILAAIASGKQPRATYYPSAGQYWLAFPDYPSVGVTETFVYSLTNAGTKVGAWTRYQFPFTIEAFAQLADDLYIKHGRFISRVDELLDTDELTVGVSVVQQPFPGRVQWSWLDFGTPGVTKMLNGFDYVGIGQAPAISIGFDQRNQSLFTTPYQLSADTLPGGLIPLPVMAPTMSVRLDFVGGEAWKVQSVMLDFFEMGNGP